MESEITEKIEKLSPGLDEASWIWPTVYHELHNAFACFRRVFEIDAVDRGTRMWITADQQYQLWINGRYVGRGPARGYASHWPVDQYDITPWLRRGSNLISVRAYNPGCSTFSYLHERAAGLLAVVEIDGKLLLKTDDTWRCRSDSAMKSDTRRLSLQLPFQEWIDLSRWSSDWIERIDDTSQDWKPPRMQVRMGSMPWHGLEPRGVPSLTTEIRPYCDVVSQAAGFTPEGAPDEPAERQRFRDSHGGLNWRIKKQPCPEALELPASEAEYPSHAVVVDLGEPGIGSLIIEVDSTAGGTLDLILTERLTLEGGPLLTDPAIANELRMGIRFHLTPGRHRYETGHLYGHRFVTAIIESNPAPALVKLGLRETVYPFEVIGSFSSSDQELNAIHKICERTQRICSLDAFVDTPFREQAQWWGDARVQSQNMFHLVADPRLLRRGIDQIADPAMELPNGLTYGHAPTIAHNCVLPDFSLVWVLTLWDHYFQTGKTDAYRQHRERLDRLIAYFEGEGRDARTGLLRYDPRYWLFLDWTDGLYRSGVPTLLNLWYLMALDRLGDLAKASGNHEDMSKWHNLRQRHSAAVEKHLWVEQAQRYRDGLTDEGRPVDRYTVHNQVLAVLCQLHPESHLTLKTGLIAAALAEDPQLETPPSLYWLTYLYDAAERLAMHDAVIESIRRRWSPMLADGGCWEQVDGDRAFKSCSHAWSAHPLFHLVRCVAGIKQSQPGWSKITFNPNFYNPRLTSVKVTVPTPHGAVQAEWSRDRDAAKISLELPPEVSATFVMGSVVKELAPGQSLSESITLT